MKQREYIDVIIRNLDVSRETSGFLNEQNVSILNNIERVSRETIPYSC